MLWMVYLRAPGSFIYPFTSSMRELHSPPTLSTRELQHKPHGLQCKKDWSPSLASCNAGKSDQLLSPLPSSIRLLSSRSSLLQRVFSSPDLSLQVICMAWQNVIPHPFMLFSSLENIFIHSNLFTGTAQYLAAAAIHTTLQQHKGFSNALWRTTRIPPYPHYHIGALPTHHGTSIDSFSFILNIGASFAYHGHLTIIKTSYIWAYHNLGASVQNISFCEP